MRHFIIENKPRLVVICEVLILIALFFGLMFIEQISGPGSLALSADSGFYDDDFELKIEKVGRSRNCTIFYTLDGTAPSIESFSYTEPIQITDYTQNPNVHSARTDTTPQFGERRLGTSLVDVIPGNVDKCTIVRAILVDENNVVLDEEMRVYFVDFSRKVGYDDLYTVSIVTDPENLFDPHKGIYVQGNEFAQFTAHSEVPWFDWPANYYQRGVESERECTVTIFDTQNTMLLSEKAGLRVKGNTSRAYSQKSLNLFARENYSGSNLFSAQLFETGPSHKITLFSGSQDLVGKFSDYYVSCVANDYDMNLDTSEMIPCTVFINNEYWGVYYLMESIDDHYIETKYGIDNYEILGVKNFQYSFGDESYMYMYEELGKWFAETDLTQKENYERACEIIDIDNYASYYAIQLYINNFDFPQNNVVLWRPIKETGKWRWVLFDLNHRTFSNGANNLVERDPIQWSADWDGCFAALIQNETFQKLLTQQLYELSIGAFSLDAFEGFMDEWEEVMFLPLVKSGERYFGSPVATLDLMERIDDIRGFMTDRPDVVRECLCIHFGDAVVDQCWPSKK